jgi:hypothetical protein
MATEKLSHMELQKRAKGIAAVCQLCFHATAYIQNGYMIINGRHGSQAHSNLLTAEDLERLAKLVRESSAKSVKMHGDKVA